MILSMSIYYLSSEYRKQHQCFTISVPAPQSINDTISLTNYYECKEIQYDATYHDATCCISMEKIQPNDKLIELPCLHYFSVSSITKWLNICSTCPVCRRKVKSI